MMSREQNDQLSRVGPDTLMGKLLRRYWAPFLLVSEIPEPDCPPVRVTLMGEKLICFRDSKGRIGLIDEFCAHRGVSLWFGQKRRMRTALSLPRLEIRRDRTVRRSALGAGRKRLPKEHQAEILPLHREGGDACGPIWGRRTCSRRRPRWSGLTLNHRARFVSKRLQECNYLQAMEGGIDSSHVSWLHGASSNKDPLFKGSKGNVYNEQDRMPLVRG